MREQIGEQRGHAPIGAAHAILPWVPLRLHESMPDLACPCYTTVGPLRQSGTKLAQMGASEGPKFGHAQLGLPIQYLRESHLVNAGEELAKIGAKHCRARVGLLI